MADRLRLGILGALVVVVGVGGPVSAGNETALVGRCAELLTEATSGDPVIPPAALREARSILIAPAVVDLQLGVGLRTGQGVVVARQGDGTWGEPQIVRFSGGSLGFAGRTVTDTIMLFNAPVSAAEAVERHRLGAVKFGIWMAVQAAGSWQAAAAKAGRDPDDLVTVYQRSRGVVAGGGVALESVAAVERTPRRNWLPAISKSGAAPPPAAVVAPLLPPSPALDHLKATLARVAAVPTAEVAIVPLPLTR